MERALFIYKQTNIEIKYSIKFLFNVLEVNQYLSKIYLLTKILFLVIRRNVEEKQIYDEKPILMVLEENVLPMSVVKQRWLSWTKHSAERQNLWLICHAKLFSQSSVCRHGPCYAHSLYTWAWAFLDILLVSQRKKKCYLMPLGIHYRYHLGCRMMRVWQTASILVYLCQYISPVNPKSHLYHVDLLVFVHDIPLHKNVQPDTYKF